MIRSSTLLLIGIGFLSGWLLPFDGSVKSSASQDSSSSFSSNKKEKRREIQKSILLRQLLDETELRDYQKDCADSLSTILALVRSGNYRPDDITLIVDMDPLAAIDQILNDPGMASGIGEQIADSWARKDPEKAIRHLWKKTNYRADDCLTQALKVGYATHPELVAEVIQSKPRHWQEYHLESLFKGTYTARKPGAPPIAESEDPFADDGYWITGNFGESILHCLADDGLRAKARTFWDQSPQVNLAKTEPITSALNVAQYSPNDNAKLYDALQKREKETRRSIIQSGNYLARKEALEYFSNFSAEPESWPADLIKLESYMNEFGVVVDRPPFLWQRGYILYGPEVAAWIDRQPLALRRAWATTFVQTWAEIDPAAALDWALALPQAASRDKAYQSGLIIWTHRDPAAAIAAVEALPPGDLRESAISNAAATWATLDRHAAHTWLDSLPESTGKSRAKERLRK